MPRKSARSLRVQLTALVVALLIASCAILVVLVNYYTSISFDTANLGISEDSDVYIVMEGDSMKADIGVHALMYLAIVVAFGSVAAYFLIRHYTRPLQRLAARMRNTGPDSLSQKMDMKGNSQEVEELVRSFNQMARQLNEAFAMQGRFSSSAAHELRTPLAIMQTKIEIFRKKSRTLHEYEALIDMCEANTKRLSSVVSDLLELTETGELSVRERICLPDVLEQVCEDLAPIAAEHEVMVSLEGSAGGDGHKPVVYGGADLLYRSFFNLVENAIRYNVEGGSVKVDVGCQGDDVFVTIADTGKGIDPDQRDLVFEPFHRVDKSLSRAYGGAGIGLALSKTILSRHGASISVGGNSPRGCVFTIMFHK